MLKDQQAISSRALVVRSKRVGRVQVIALGGQLDVGNCATAETQLETALDEAGSQVVIDTRELEFIDSTGIGLLMTALSSRERVETLRFIPGRAPAVARVLEHNGIDDRAMLADPRPAMRLRALGAA